MPAHWKYCSGSNPRVNIGQKFPILWQKKDLLSDLCHTLTYTIDKLVVYNYAFCKIACHIIAFREVLILCIVECAGYRALIVMFIMAFCQTSCATISCLMLHTGEVEETWFGWNLWSRDQRVVQILDMDFLLLSLLMWRIRK